MNRIPVSRRIVAVVGWHNSGKSTFIVRLLGAAKARGLRVGVIKHTRGEFVMDREGTDTWRFREAGADLVAISGPRAFAVYEALLEEESLERVLARLPKTLDFIILEGYKGADVPKIEVWRQEVGGPRIASQGDLIALVSDSPGSSDEHLEVGFDGAEQVLKRIMG